MGAGVPEGFPVAGVAERVGFQLQQGFDAGLGPELFAPLHPVVEQFHRGLDVAGGGRQTLSAALGIIHLPALVLQIRQGFADNPMHAGGAVFIAGQPQLLLSHRQFFDHPANLSLPAPRHPPHVNFPARFTALTGRGGGINGGQGMDDVQNSDEPERFEVLLPERPDPTAPIAHRCFAGTGEHPQGPRPGRQHLAKFRGVPARGDHVAAEDFRR